MVHDHFSRDEECKNMKQFSTMRKDCSFKLPLVDFSSFSSATGNADADAAAQLHTAKTINHVNRRHGFVCLRNSGIPHSLVQSTFKASKLLFDLDEGAKTTLKQIDPKTNTGYVGYGGETLNRHRKPDLKEAFNVRQQSLQNGDLEGTPHDFESATKILWKHMKELGSHYSVCCALALGLDDHRYFSQTMDSMDLCTLRLLHYPPCEGGTDSNLNPDLNPDSSCAIRLGEHTDFGLFTFLFVHDYHDESSLGLQVKAIEGSEYDSYAHLDKGDDGDGVMSGWNDVIFDQESLKLLEGDDTCAVIVNTGALMARWTNDIWRATAHRVVVSPKAFSSHRYSIAMFFDPDPEVVCSVHPKFVKEGEEPKYPPIQSLDYLLMKLKEAQGVVK